MSPAALIIGVREPRLFCALAVFQHQRPSQWTCVRATRPGPFPLAAFAHGNHNPFANSTPGYLYLCQLLASHGIIAATIDVNFLNGFGFTDEQMFGTAFELRAAVIIDRQILRMQIRPHRAIKDDDAIS